MLVSDATIKQIEDMGYEVETTHDTVYVSFEADYETEQTSSVDEDVADLIPEYDFVEIETTGAYTKRAIYRLPA